MSFTRSIIASGLLAVYSLILLHGLSGHVHNDEGGSIHAFASEFHAHTLEEHQHHHIHISDLLSNILNLISHTDIGKDHLETYIVQSSQGSDLSPQQFTQIKTLFTEAIPCQNDMGLEPTNFLFKPPPNLVRQFYMVSAAKRGPPHIEVLLNC